MIEVDSSHAPITSVIIPAMNPSSLCTGSMTSSGRFIFDAVSQSTTASERYKVWHGNIPDIIFTRVSIFLENDSMAIPTSAL